MAIKPAIHFIWPGAAALFQSINRPMWPVTLQKIVSKSRFHPGPEDYPAMLLQQFGQPLGNDLPMAALRFPGQTALCADPCYLHPDRDRLMLFQQDIQLSDDEARQLQDAIQPLLAEFDAQLVTFSSKHWGLTVPELPALTCHNISSLEGQPVTDSLPEGLDQHHWRRLLNEIQMLLFEHPVNQQREARGQLPVNALWLSGIASLQIVAGKWQQVVGKDRVLENLASVLNIDYTKNPADFLKKRPDKSSLMVLPDFEHQADWPQQLHNIEQQFLNPVWHYLRRWQISHLYVSVPQHGVYGLANWRSWL